MPFRDYSTSTRANTTIGDETYVGPNMPRDNVRPAVQQLMADGKALQTDFALAAFGSNLGYYEDTAAGLAATESGGFFAVLPGDGSLVVYLNSNGTASEQANIAAAVDVDALTAGSYLFVHSFYQDADGDDDTLAFERAAQAAAGSGKTLAFLPGEGHAQAGATYDRDGDTLTFSDWAAGDYVIGVSNQNVDPTLRGNLLSDLSILIPAGTTVWHKPMTTYVFYHNPIGIGTVRGTPHTVGADDAAAISNVEIRIDGQLRGNNVVEGFEENSALISLSAVNGATIHGSGSLIGFKGDAIAIISGDVGPFDLDPEGAKQIRHNRNVTISGLTLDGVNKNNRNGISALDFDGLLIENCTFKNTSRPGNGNVTPADPYDPNTGFGMPGAIDVEGNIFSMPWLVCRNFTVRNCSFIDNGSGGMVFNLTPNTYVFGGDTYTNVIPTQNLTAENNFFDNCLFAFSTFGDTEGEAYNIAFRNNAVQDCSQPFRLSAGKGVKVDGNTFLRCDLAGFVGLALGLEKGLEQLDITGNTFELCGNSIGAWQTLDNITNFKWNDNTFKDCAGYAFAITGSGTIQKGEIKRNRAIVTEGAAKVMEGAIAYLTFSGTPTIINHSITEEGNDWAGLRNFQFTVNGSRSPSVPAGNWVRGSFVLYPDAPPGEPTRLDNIYPVSGAADPTAWAETLKPGGPADGTGITFTGTKSAGMAEANGRFTSTDTGTQWAYTTATLPQSPGAEIIMRAPRTGWSGISVGFTDAASITDASGIDYAVLFDLGNLFGTVDGALFGPAFDPQYTYEWMQTVRVKMVSNIVTLYTTNPFTGVETLIYTSSTIGGVGAVRMGIAITQEGQSVQVTKFAAP